MGRDRIIRADAVHGGRKRRCTAFQESEINILFLNLIATDLHDFAGLRCFRDSKENVYTTLCRHLGQVCLQNEQIVTSDRIWSRGVIMSLARGIAMQVAQSRVDFRASSTTTAQRYISLRLLASTRVEANRSLICSSAYCS